MTTHCIQHLIMVTKPLCDCCWTEVRRSTHQEETTRPHCGRRVQMVTKPSYAYCWIEVQTSMHWEDLAEMYSKWL